MQREKLPLRSTPERQCHRQIHTGAYRAQASRRGYIAKADGKQRPLGIAAVEDKIVQQAVVKVLSAYTPTQEQKTIPS